MLNRRNTSAITNWLIEGPATGKLNDISHRPSHGILILSDAKVEETPESPSLDFCQSKNMTIGTS